MIDNSQLEKLIKQANQGGQFNAAEVGQWLGSTFNQAKIPLLVALLTWLLQEEDKDTTTMQSLKWPLGAGALTWLAQQYITPEHVQGFMEGLRSGSNTP